MPVKNTCDCHDPPGGQVVCEPHQMAVCSVFNGVARRECKDPPSVGGDAALLNWALAHITGSPREPQAAIDYEDLHILSDNRVVRSNGAVVTFALPEEVALALQRLATTHGNGGETLEAQA